MTTKEYLSQAFILDKQIKSKLRRVEILRNMTQRASSIIYDIPKRPSNVVSPMEEALVKMMDLENELNDDMNRLVDTIKAIQGAIQTVNDIDCETVLEMRYLAFMKWEEIWTTLDMGRDQVFRVHRKALNMVKIVS